MNKKNLKNYVIELLREDGSLYDEIIFKSTEEEATKKFRLIASGSCVEIGYTFQLKRYYGDGKSSKKILLKW